MKTGIIGILNNPATSLNSHSAGMVNIVKELFKADILNEKNNWSEYERLIIYHGVNFKKGSFNIIGGLNKKIIQRCKKLELYNGEINSLDGFQLCDFSIKRKLISFDNYKTIKEIELPIKNKIVIGDSHSISVWPNDEYSIIRNDGKTLHGFLKSNLDLSIYDHTILYFGNIDIRFHLARQINPELATKDLFNRYCDYASKYNCKLTTLLPIENESRKIPKSGQYKGKNFFGSKELRKELRNIANKIISESGLDYFKWPSSFLNSENDLSFDIMEPKQSVHIRPMYYQRNILNNQLELF
jgi:hypothetical protein